MLDMIRAERTLMFSSDYPHWDYDPPEKIISLIPQSIRRRVMVENALELYGSRLA
jgi:predicted TIM-barrel fold metal-dependent hydrolase